MVYYLLLRPNPKPFVITSGRCEESREGSPGHQLFFQPLPSRRAVTVAFHFLGAVYFVSFSLFGMLLSLGVAYTCIYSPCQCDNKISFIFLMRNFITQTARFRVFHGGSDVGNIGFKFCSVSSLLFWNRVGHFVGLRWNTFADNNIPQLFASSNYLFICFIPLSCTLEILNLYSIVIFVLGL